MKRALVAGVLAVIASALLAASAAAKATTQPVGFQPLSSASAATLVVRNGIEPRPGNAKPNHTIPGGRMLRVWRHGNKMPYARNVDGRFTGTTDEIIQWAAYKWGLDEDILRAAAARESWWKQSAVGDGGDSFGLFQVRRPFHCSGKCKIARRSTAFNADYYAATVRAYFDGKMAWLGKQKHGAPYIAGDIWGSVGAWFAGRWWTAPAASYIAEVQSRLTERPWEKPYFLSS